MELTFGREEGGQGKKIRNVGLGFGGGTWRRLLF